MDDPSLGKHCEQFEIAWRSQQRPEIESYLEQVPQDQQAELLIALLRIDLWRRRHEFPAPTAAEYARRFPEHRQAIQQAVTEFHANQASQEKRPSSRGMEPSADGAPELDLTLPAISQSTKATEGFESSFDQVVDSRVQTQSGDRIQYFGEYQLLDEISRGGMGVVFRARQVKLNRIVALKMILKGQLASAEDVQRFYFEAEAAAQLDHPGIVPIFEVGDHIGQHYFSMAFVEGESLADKISGGLLSPREAASFVATICDAIAYAHEQGVIHRDLKPANILIDRNGQPKVTDFGLAKKIAADGNLTGSGQILGTPGFMPPEQASGHQDVGPKADIYALGATLYCLLTGRPPFQSANAIDTIFQVIHHDPIPPSQLTVNLPLDLETICLKCLQKSSSDRYEAVIRLREDLNRFLEGHPIVARPPGMLERATKWLSREPIAGSAILASILVVVVRPYPAFLVCAVVAGLLIGPLQKWSWSYVFAGAVFGAVVGAMTFFGYSVLDPETSSLAVHSAWWAATCVVIGTGIRNLVDRSARHAKTISLVTGLSLGIAGLGYAIRLFLMRGVVPRFMGSMDTVASPSEELLVTMIATYMMYAERFFYFVFVILGGISIGMLIHRLNLGLARRCDISPVTLHRVVAACFVATCFLIPLVSVQLTIYFHRVNAYLPIFDASMQTQWNLRESLQLLLLGTVFVTLSVIPCLIIQLVQRRLLSQR